MHSIDRLQELAQIERVRLRGVVSLAERAAADVVVIGATAPPSVALDVIGELKRHPRTAPIPALHLVAAGAGCGTCGADVCLPADAAPATLVSVARTLLRVRAAESARTPEDEAPDRDGLVAAASTAERLIALGRLAGGVVHDFNNLLLVMEGHVELARRLVGEGHPATARLATVQHAVERAAALNRQLLAFGRPAPSPEPLTDLDAVTTQLAPMLRRLLGEYVRLELRTGSATRPGAGRCDAGGAAAAQPGAERARRHARGRPAERRDPGRADRRRQRAARAPRPLRGAVGLGRGRGDRCRRARAALRAVLHDEVRRRRIGARARDRAPRRAAGGRPRERRQRARPRHTFRVYLPRAGERREADAAAVRRSGADGLRDGARGGGLGAGACRSRASCSRTSATRC